MHTKDILTSVPAKGAALVGAFGLTLLLSGCSGPANTLEAEPSVAEGCAAKLAHELPSATNVEEINDDSRTYIRACNFLQDLNLSYSSASDDSGEPAKLQRAKPTTIESTNFKLRSNFGGWAFLGVGSVSGETKADGSTTVKDVYKIRVADTLGAYATMTLDAEKVRIKSCEPDTKCVPAMDIKIPENVIYIKSQVTPGGEWKPSNGNIIPDTTSIWSVANGDQCQYGFWSDTNSECQAQLNKRKSIISKVVATKELDDGLVAYGGPKTPGEVISELATRITLTLPAEALEDA